MGEDRTESKDGDAAPEAKAKSAGEGASDPPRLDEDEPQNNSNDRNLEGQQEDTSKDPEDEECGDLKVQSQSKDFSSQVGSVIPPTTSAVAEQSSTPTSSASKDTVPRSPKSKPNKPTISPSAFQTIRTAVRNRERRSSDDGTIVTAHISSAPTRAPTKTPPASMPASPIGPKKDRATIDWASVPSLLQPSSSSALSSAGAPPPPPPPPPSSVPPSPTPSHLRLAAFRSSRDSSASISGDSLLFAPSLPDSTPVSSGSSQPGISIADETSRKNAPGLQQLSSSNSTTTASDYGPLRDILSMEQQQLQLPTPKPPAKCPLFCVFYAEFDIKVGPVLCFQSPKQFMDHDIEISTDKVHSILKATFDHLCPPSKDDEDSDIEDDLDVDVDNPHERDTKEGPKSPVSDAGEASSSPQDPAKASVTEKAITDPVISDGSLSIFDSTSEYIITGNELSGKLINLSTHQMHIMTRPTIISDERYERNSLLFSVGFVLRRAADPRPFRPLLSKLALTLRSMEIESKFLSNPASRTQLQPLLERVLVSLNSNHWECNLLLNKSNALNLKLFHPPRPDVVEIHDHEVPVLLRKDIQLSMYDWDLAINWVILHIDGVTNARLISVKAEVDMEMVRSCLRVLKYHGVIALVDMFMYSNRYEFTDKATALLAGKDPNLLQDAVSFCAKRPTIGLPSGVATSPLLMGSAGPPSIGGGSDTSPLLSVSPHPSSPSDFLSSGNRSSFQAHSMSLLASSNKSSTLKMAVMAAHSLDRENNLSSIGVSKKPEENKQLKAAIGELYCRCQRNMSFGDLWIALTTQSPHNNHNNIQHQRASFGPRSSSGSSGIHHHHPRNNSNNVSRMDSVSETSLDVQNDSSSPSNHNHHHSIDWNQVFEQFDHRRFVSFGLVHGLIVRVHNYPYFPGGPLSFPRGTSLFHSDNNHSSFGSSNHPNDSSAASKHRAAAAPAGASGEKDPLSHDYFVRRVASLMDGTRCDDELVCILERPFATLVQLVETSTYGGGCKVVTTYSTSLEA